MKRDFEPPRKIRTDKIERLEVAWNHFKIKVPHERVKYQSKIYAEIQDVNCQETLQETRTFDMVQGTYHTVIDIINLQPSCVYQATFTIWMFSGKSLHAVFL